MWKHPSGDQYNGTFENDLRHGFGTYRLASGREWTGEWRHGRQFQQTDHYGQHVGGVVYQSRGEAAGGPGGHASNAVPGWMSGKGAGKAGGPGGAGKADGTYDVVVNRAAPQGEGAYDVVVKKGGPGGPAAASEGAYDVVVNRGGPGGPAVASEGAYDVVVNREGAGGGVYDVVVNRAGQGSGPPPVVKKK